MMVWYDYIVRALVMGVALLVVTRWMGKRVVGMLTPLDFVAGITVGTIAGATTVSMQVPLWAGLVGLGTWGVFQWVNALLGRHWAPYQKLVVGQSDVLVQDGKFQDGTLQRLNISPSTVRQQLQTKKVWRLGAVKRATIEPSGKLGLQLRKSPTKK